METVVERPAGLDVHKERVTGWVRVPGEGGGRERHIAEFATMVRGLLALRDWVAAHRVAQVTMEATGVYWKPVWAILGDDLNACWSTLGTSSRSRGARPTSQTPCGSVSWRRRGCCGRASCRPSQSAGCAI